MHPVYSDENNEMEMDNSNNLGHIIYDDFNHNAKITMRSGHNEPTTCATIILDSGDNIVICDLSLDTLENTFHVYIIICSDLPVNATASRVVIPPTIFITSCAATIMKFRNEFNRAHNHSFFSKICPARWINLDISSASWATSSAKR